MFLFTIFLFMQEGNLACILFILANNVVARNTLVFWLEVDLGHTKFIFPYNVVSRKMFVFVLEGNIVFITIPSP